MLVLVLNAGSSSIKYQLFDMPAAKIIASGIAERLGGSKDYKDAVGRIIKGIDRDDIAGVGHRVVHGGERFKSSAVITKKILAEISRFNELAPLHNPPALSVIKACRDILKGVPQVAVFDTAFHRTLPDYASLYALPYELSRKYGIRRYGFHGTSHRYIALKAAELMPKKKGLKVISCHLGNGCSISAIKDGRSIDTSLGFTPLEGLVMGTRSGDIDPSIIFFLASKSFSLHKIEEMLNKKSGLLGISGVSNDMRDILKAMKRGSKRARLAFEIFIYRLVKYIGAYMAVLGGCDALIFTAGIGENQPRVRTAVRRALMPLIKKFNTRVLVVHTDEESLIAFDTFRLIERR